jgi:hypothetical protein
MASFYPFPPPIPFARQDKSRRRVRTIAAIGACAAVFTAGALGVVVGSCMTDEPKPIAAQTPPMASAALIRAQTVDLCTRFAAAYAALPVPQNNAADVVPEANYIADAVRDDSVADPAIRAAVAKSLKLARDHASRLSRERPRGAIQPATGWKAAESNDADDVVFDLCSSYQG